VLPDLLRRLSSAPSPDALSRATLAIVRLEGHRASLGSVQALLEHAAPTSAADHAAAGTALALHHVDALADDPQFAWSSRLLLDLHFELCWSRPDARPGRLRRQRLWVSAPEGGSVYQAPPAEQLPHAVEALVAWLSTDDDTPPVVRAAMAHLHVMALQPFADGNLGAAAVLQALVLRRAGLPLDAAATALERFARDPSRTHGALRQVLGDLHEPTRSAAPWVAFVLGSHRLVAEEELALRDQHQQRQLDLQRLVAARSLPERLVAALEHSLDASAVRSRYAQQVGVSVATASNDLRRLVDAGWVRRAGKARHTHYIATASLRRQLESTGSDTTD
jgi:Fic family protein